MFIREGEKVLTEQGTSRGCQEGCRAVAHQGMDIRGCGAFRRAQMAHGTQDYQHSFHTIKRVPALHGGSTETSNASNHFTRQKVQDDLWGGESVCVSPVMDYNALWTMYIKYCHILCPALLIATVSHRKYIITSRFLGRVGRGFVLQN